RLRPRTTSYPVGLACAFRRRRPEPELTKYLTLRTLKYSTLGGINIYSISNFPPLYRDGSSLLSSPGK
ncbi:MAG: hypothetical protein L6R40_008616, partial [Gallowayella cf. fulva]